MNFGESMEWICLIMTLCLFSSGIPPCIKMYKNKDTRNVPFNLFLLNVLSCSGMYHYAVMNGNSTLIILNGIGAILQCSYVLAYLLVTENKASCMKRILLACVYLVLLYTYLYSVVIHGDEVADWLGFITSLIIAGIMALPALELSNNVKEKNADGVPFIMVITSLISSTCWLIYGKHLDDPNIYSPNYVGISVALCKLAVIFVYGQNEQKEPLKIE